MLMSINKIVLSYFSSHIIYPYWKSFFLNILCVFNIGVIYNANINSPLRRLNTWAKPYFIILLKNTSKNCTYYLVLHVVSQGW